MSEHKIRVDVELDTSEAQKKLDSLAKEKRKINVDVDSSDIDEASKKADNLKNKNIKVDAKVTGKETIDSTAKSLDKATKSASGFGNSVKSFAKFGAYLHGFQLLTQVTQEAVEAIKEIDAAIVNLQMATGDSYENVRQLVSGYNQLAQTLGATTTEISKGADTWLRQGKSISETNRLLQDTMVLSKVAQIDSDDSSSYLTAIMKGYKMAADEVEGINDSLTSIDLAAAVDAGGLAEATSRVAASADLAGVSLNRLLGYEAAIGEASQESMSVIGNSLRSVFQRMSMIKSGNLELIDEDGTTQTLNDVETVFENIGVPLRDSTNEFRNFGDVLDEVAAKWDNLSSVQKSAVSTAASGNYQSNRFKLLMENYDKALQYEQIAESSSGTAMAKFEDGYLNSIEAKTKSLQAAFESLSSNLISRDTINGILEATQALVEFLDKTSLVKGALAGFAAGAVLKGFSLISAGIAKATVGITSFGDAAKKAFSALKANPIAVISTVIGLVTAAWSAYNQAVEESIQRAKEITSAWDESNSSLNEQISKYKELKSQLDSGTLSPDEEYSTRQQILDIQKAITSQYGEQAEGVSLVNGNLEQQLALLQQIAAENALTELNKGMDEYKSVAQQMEKERSYLIGSAPMINDNAISKDIYNLAKEYENLGISIKDVSEASGLEDGTSFEIYFDGDATQADKVISDFMNRVSELKDQYRDDVGAISFIDDSNYYAADALKENQKILDDYQDSYNKFLKMDMLSRGTGDGSVADIYYEYADAISAYNEALASGDSNEINKTRSEFQKLGEEVDSVLSEGDNEKFTSLFDGVEETLDEAAIKLNDFNEALSGKAGDSNTFKDTAADIKTASDELKGLNLDVQEVRDALITDGVQNGEKQILALADAWGVAADSSEEEINQFLSVLEEAGIITGQVGSATDAATASYDAFSSSVSNAKDNLSTLQDIMSESASGTGISSENVQAFRDMFGDDAEKALEKTANGYHINVDALRELQSQQETLTKSDYLSALSDQYELLAENSEKLAKAQFMGEDTSGLEATRQGILDQISSLEDLKLQYDAATSAYQNWINAQNNGNERDMYDNIQSGYESVRDLIERGWGGSDEVRTYVDLLSGKDLSTAPVEEVIQAYEDLGKTIGNTGYSILDFFTVDEDGNTTTDGIYNFFDTVRSVLGEEYAKLEDGKYTFNFGEGRDQDVAEALNMDVAAVQSILRAASEAGFEINLDQPVASLEELKTSAQSAQEALASMDDTTLSGIDLDSTSFSEITDNISKVEDYIEEISDSDLEPEVKTEKLEDANAILEYLVEMQNEAGNNSIEISVNADELEQAISDAESALDKFKNDSGQVDLSVEGAQEAVDDLQTLLAQKEQLNAPTVMSVDTSQVDGELSDALAKIQEYQSAVQDLNVQTELKTQGVDIDTSAAQEKVNNLAAEIQGINPDITAKLNIDTSSASTIQSSIQAITPEILVKAGVDSSAIANYTPGDKDASVKYKVDASAVDAWNASDKSAKVIYYPDTSNLPTTFTQLTRTVKYVPSGDVEVNGSAHANGSTVKAYRFNNWRGQANASGNWGIKKGGLSLVGELGQEILVRGSEFHTIGDNGAEFIQTRPGDIIFNHKQAESLLKNGHVTSRGKMIGGNANVNGSAYSSGSGGLGRPSKPSYGMNNSSASSSTGSSSGNSSSASDAAKEFEETIDWIEMAIDRLERAIDTLDLKASSTYRSWSERNQSLSSEISKVTEEINLQQQGYNRYLQQANSIGLSWDWASKVQNGDVDISTVTDEDLANKIKEYENWYTKALDCRDAIEELRETESELYEQAFDHISTMFDGIVGQLEHFRNMIEGYVDQTETAGYLVSQEYYSVLIDNEEQTLAKLNEERNQLVASLNDAVNSGAITKESEAWYSMMEEINSVDEAIQDSTTSIIEFKNEIRQIEWDIFDKFQEAVSGITTESDFLVDLMSNDKLFDDRGQITDQGKATMGLHGVNYNTYMSQADEYRKAIDELNKEIEKDPYNQTLLERRKELLELQQESILAANDEKEAIRDLVEDGINAELDSLQDLIDKYTEALDSQADLYDYQLQIAEKQQEIANLEKQLAAYQGDDSEEGASKRQELQNQLDEARQDMEATLFERSISEQKKLLNELYSDFESTLNMRLDNIDLLLMDIVGNVNSESSAIRDTIISEANDVGYQLTDTMNTIWGDGSKLMNVLTTYGNNFTSAITGVQTAINDLKDIMKKAIEDANRRAQSNISNTNGSSSGSSSGGSSSGSNTNTPSSSQGNGTPNIGDAVTFVSGSYYYSSDGLTPTGNQLLGQTVYITKVNNASWATKPYHIARDAAGTRPLGWVSLDQIRGYKTGSKYISEDQLAWTNEDGNPETIITKDGSILTPLPKGSSVLNTAAHNNLWDMATDPSDFIKRNLDIDTSALLAQNNKPSQINNTISINIPIDRVQDYNDFIRQLQNDPKAEKLIQAIAFDQVTGRGRMGKYKVNFNN